MVSDIGRRMQERKYAKRRPQRAFFKTILTKNRASYVVDRAIRSVLTIRLAAAEVCAVSLVSQTAEREITLLDKTIFFSLYNTPCNS